MSKLFLLFLSTLCISAYTSRAQTPFNTIDSVDINNITPAVLVHGDMWWNPTPGLPFCQFPAHSGKNLSFPGSIWISGYDNSGGLHVSAQTYRQDGNDYWPGPLDAADTLTYATSQNWDKIWKVKRTDIQYFRALASPSISNTPAAILTWPANGNVYAQGYGGVALSVSGNMAPFVDLNGDGIYEPLLGEYPDVPGDEALWWIFSDNGPTHTSSNGKPLGIEVHAMAYAYSRGTLIDNVVYYDYTVVNRSVKDYQDVRVAQWDDVGLGFYLDDFIGFDSTWRMGIVYDGTNDDGASGGHPVNSYGLDPPQMGVTMIVLPGDAGGSYVQPGSFVYYNNDNSVIGNPTVDTEYNNYMRAKLRGGQHFTDDFSGPGSPSVGYGSGPDCNYVFPGDPSDRAQWSECASNNGPSNRLFVFSSNDFTLNAGSSAHLVFALVVADSAKGCPVTSFDSIRVVADTAWNIYHNPLSPLFYTAVNNVPMGKYADVQLFPNPASTSLTINASENITNITITNIIGQTVYTNNYNTQKIQVDVSTLPNGIYFVKVNGSEVRKFVKE